MSLFLVILSVLNICFVGINSLGTYNYDDADMGKGPSGWPVECKTTLQSPINIIEDDVQRIPYPAVLNIEKYSASPDFETAKKEEFNLEFRFKYPGDKQSILSGGPLGTDIYLFEKLNFHWGDNW